MSDREKNMRNTDNEKTMFIPGSKSQQRNSAPQRNHPYSSRQSAYQPGEEQFNAQQGSRQSQQQRYPQNNQPYSSRQGAYQQNGQQQYGTPQGNGRSPQQYGGQQGYRQDPRQYGNQRYDPRQPINAPNGYPAQNQRGRSAPQQQRQSSDNRQRPPRRQQQQQRPQKQRRQAPKKQHKSLAAKIILRIVFILLAVFLLIFGIYSCTALAIIGKIDKAETGARDRTSGAMSAKYVTSVLIIGSDGRSDGERGRSD